MVDAVCVPEAYETGRPADVNTDGVATREKVIAVIHAMVENLRGNPDAWENATLDRFLEALAASLEGVEHAYANRGEILPTQPSWQLVAELLVMASGYE